MKYDLLLWLKKNNAKLHNSNMTNDEVKAIVEKKEQFKMKQLICEMCGGNDLIKNEGVFVCQSCGTKYSVEDAKKMMVEGNIKVEGTVKIDTTDQIGNLMKSAIGTFEEGKYTEAAGLFSQVLAIQAENELAVLYRGLSAGWQTNGANCRIMEAASAAERALDISHRKYGDSKEFFDFAYYVLLKYNELPMPILQLYGNLRMKQMKRLNEGLNINNILYLKDSVDKAEAELKKEYNEKCTIISEASSSVVSTMIKLSNDWRLASAKVIEQLKITCVLIVDNEYPTKQLLEKNVELIGVKRIETIMNDYWENNPTIKQMYDGLNEKVTNSDEKIRELNLLRKSEEDRIAEFKKSISEQYSIIEKERKRIFGKEKAAILINDANNKIDQLNSDILEAEQKITEIRNQRNQVKNEKQSNEAERDGIISNINLD